MQVNVEGALLDTGFVTGVATYPEYAGIGLISTLIRQALTDQRGRGQSISFLGPYSIPFYRHKGWEIVSDLSLIHIWPGISLSFFLFRARNSARVFCCPSAFGTPVAVGLEFRKSGTAPA